MYADNLDFYAKMVNSKKKRSRVVSASLNQLNVAGVFYSFPVLSQFCVKYVDFSSLSSSIESMVSVERRFVCVFVKSVTLLTLCVFPPAP